MDVLEIIRSDHQKLLDGIDRLEETAEGFREDKFNLVMRDNLDHMKAEEDVFYPLINQHAPEAMMKAIEAHNIARLSMDDLSLTPKNDPWWVAKLQVFRDISLSHIREEEGPIFDIARRAMSGDELQEMGKRFQAAKKSSIPRPPAEEASAGSGR
ncbi:MAG: hemerythrin domain-containing protein [Methanotrichaceae archaeon]